MHMDISAVVMPVRVGAYQHLMSGEMLFTELLAQRLRPVYSQAVVWCVTGVKTDNVVSSTSTRYSFPLSIAATKSS